MGFAESLKMYCFVINCNKKNLATESEDCKKRMVLCLTASNLRYVKIFQESVKMKEKKSNYNRTQTINRIIAEWVEDRQFMLDVVKKEKG